jgi:hypothetical protein
MKILINLVLVALIGGLGYLLYDSISEPIKFKTVKDKRRQAVVDQLMEVREAQKVYMMVTGEYANTFDTLRQVLNTGVIKVEKITGDPDDPENMDKVQRDTILFPAIDSIQAMGLQLDSLEYVPYGNGEKFTMESDTTTYQQTLVNVVEVKTFYKVFMGDYADPRYAQYDNSYDPAKSLKFGNMSKPQLSGNWE